MEAMMQINHAVDVSFSGLVLEVMRAILAFPAVDDQAIALRGCAEDIISSPRAYARCGTLCNSLPLYTGRERQALQFLQPLPPLRVCRFLRPNLLSRHEAARWREAIHSIQPFSRCRPWKRRLW